MNRIHRHGLTLPELILGTAMLAIIGAALASFTTAMAAGWTNSDKQFKIENASKRSADSLETALADVLYVAQSQSTTTAVQGSFMFYWSQDGGLVATDRKAQLGEMNLIEYSPADKTVYIYKPKSTLTSSQQATLMSDNWGDPTSSAIVSYFKNLESIEKTPLVGGSDSGINVTEAMWKNFTPIGGRPMTTFTLRLSNGGAEDTSAGTVPSRAARKPTNFG